MKRRERKLQKQKHNYQEHTKTNNDSFNNEQVGNKNNDIRKDLIIDNNVRDLYSVLQNEINNNNNDDKIQKILTMMLVHLIVTN